MRTRTDCIVFFALLLVLVLRVMQAHTAVVMFPSDNGLRCPRTSQDLQQIETKRPTRIPRFPIDQLGQHMRHMFFEITRPDGKVNGGSLVVHHIEAPALSDWENRCARSASHVVLYPYMTYWCGPPSATPDKRVAPFTFDKPGTYRVRVAYCVEPTCVNLWKPDGGVLFSNSFEIRVRQATPDESSILDALWSSDRFVILCGDFATHPKSDEGKAYD
jgi:hypothetical protein